MKVFGRPIRVLWVFLTLIVFGTLFFIFSFTTNYETANSTESDAFVLKFQHQLAQATLQEEINVLKSREAILKTMLRHITTKIKGGKELVLSDLQEEIDSKTDLRRDLAENELINNLVNVPKSMKLKWAGLNPIERRKREVAKGIKPKVLVTSLPRSGSSFIGEIFNQNPEFLYLFEPTFPTMGNALWECEVSDLKMSVIATELFKCEFPRFFDSLAEKAKKDFIYKDFSTPIPILKNYTNGCEDKMVAIKEVRRWGPNLKDLRTIFGSDLKIVWLLRDPRGWVSSFLYRNNKTSPLNDFSSHPKKSSIFPVLQTKPNNPVLPKSLPTAQRTPPTNIPSTLNTKTKTLNSQHESLPQEVEYTPREDEEQKTNEEINQELDTSMMRIRYPRKIMSTSVFKSSKPPQYFATFYKAWGLEKQNFFELYYDCENLEFPQYILDTIDKKKAILENPRIAAHLRMATVWLLETMINMHYMSQLPSDNVMFVRYEDLSLYPLDIAQQIYNFIELPVVHSNVIKWITKHTQGSVDRDRYGHDRNSEEMVEVWKDRLGIEVLKDIEGICGDLMENFGYKRYNEN